MSEKSDIYPSAELFAELEQARQMAAGRERSARAWRAVGRAYGNPDWPVLVDFALEHGLVHSCEDTGPRARRGQAPRSLVWVNPVDGSEMVWIPAGSFYIGPRKNKQQAQSQGFSLARHPVTNSQFARFLEETRYTPTADHPDPRGFLSHWEDGTLPKQLEKHPVVWVSYFDALAYCDWAGLTLPTEWLWEKAARGPEGPPFPWGDQSPLPGYQERPTLANIRSGSTCPVGSYSKTRTAYGCEDMVGNVSEWCRTIEGEDHGQIPEQRPDCSIPPANTPVYAIVRGACFLRGSAASLPAWHQRRLAVTRRNRWVGFRPACFLPCFPA